MLTRFGLESRSQGIYLLSSPTFVKQPKQVDHDHEYYEYVVSADDHPDKDLLWAIERIGEILDQDRTYNEYLVGIKFHLFDAQNSLSKTPRFAAVVVDPVQKHARQLMFTRHNYEVSEFSYSSTIDFKNKLLQQIGWKTDRA
jgi:hypothetical protein